MSDTELLWLRILAFLPLIVIAVQVVLLRRIVNTRAWTLLVLGFVLFVVMRGALFFTMPPTWTVLVATFLGYSLIIAGFHRLRQDLLRMLRATVVVADGAVHMGRRKDDPKPGPVLLQEPNKEKP